MTYDSLIADAARRLRQSEIEEPRREARRLMALAADLTTADLILRDANPVPAPIAARFEAFVLRREGREPFQHIAGYTSFFGLDFISDGRALVPRADSEIVVETALDLLPRGRGVQVVDLGTGSGCLLAALLHTRGGVSGLGIEADPNAASLARENLKRHGLDDRASVLTRSWADWTGWSEPDLIISNPPYIASADIETLAPEVRLHDPRAALDGGADGLAAYRDIISRAGAMMKPGAWIVFEIGFDQREAVCGLLADAGFSGLRCAHDLSGHDRVVAGQLSIG